MGAERMQPGSKKGAKTPALGRCQRCVALKKTLFCNFGFQDCSINHAISNVRYKTKSISHLKALLVTVQSFNVTSYCQCSQVPKGHRAFTVSRQIPINHQAGLNILRTCPRHGFLRHPENIIARKFRQLLRRLITNYYRRISATLSPHKINSFREFFGRNRWHK